MKSAAARALSWLHGFENALITALVLLLVLLAGAQIVLRNAFGTSISWADPLLRALVLWTALLGALAAVREDKHISLDVLSRLLSGTALRLSRVLTFGFAAVICALAAYYSGSLVMIEFASGGIAFAGVPNWVLEIIMPIAFALMALRFALRAFALPDPEHAMIGVPDDLREGRA
ncbi:TRAP transporter small permease [Pseudolysobacter antarcticus]|uniref:TRAP transporter small permease protein n=1 Tax=Pseudolysobacter antarcticus TaxID=2511995 RepID=A0A411HJT2_9GAMM|nr:TRAP transporter small permease [Pseudolysobacter antarcticus]QBB70660.1 TRAP transporter small permease [Pseudolysobacter antarcticus]